MLLLPPKLEDGSYDETFGSIYELTFVPRSTGSQILFRGVYYDEACIRTGPYRGIRMLADDLELWEASMEGKAICSIP